MLLLHGHVIMDQLRDLGCLLQALAELLTTNKLSELACLTLYLMYEKKNGKQSVWYEFIKVHVQSNCAQLLPSKVKALF